MAVPRDENYVPITPEAAAGYVKAASGVFAPGATTTATTDYAYTWANQINHLMLQNNTGANIQWELDSAATAGSPVLATGQTLFLDVQCTAIHLYTAAQQNVNGSTAGNIVIRGWL